MESRGENKKGREGARKMKKERLKKEGRKKRQLERILDQKKA